MFAYTSLANPCRYPIPHCVLITSEATNIMTIGQTRKQTRTKPESNHAVPFFFILGVQLVPGRRASFRFFCHHQRMLFQRNFQSLQRLKLLINLRFQLSLLVQAAVKFIFQYDMSSFQQQLWIHVSSTLKPVNNMISIYFRSSPRPRAIEEEKGENGRRRNYLQLSMDLGECRLRGWGVAD